MFLLSVPLGWGVPTPFFVLKLLWPNKHPSVSSGCWHAEAVVAMSAAYLDGGGICRKPPTPRQDTVPAGRREILLQILCWGACKEGKQQQGAEGRWCGIGMLRPAAAQSGWPGKNRTFVITVTWQHLYPGDQWLAEWCLSWKEVLLGNTDWVSSGVHLVVVVKAEIWY